MKLTNYAALSFLFVLSACSSDPVQKDLLNYVYTELPKVASLETEAVNGYASVSGENYTSDSAMYYTIKQTVLPKYEEFNTKLNTIQPSTPEVKAMHQEYINAAGDQMEAFKLICLAIEKQDPEIIKQANSDLAKGRALLEVWRNDLDEQCKKHDIKLDADKK